MEFYVYSVPNKINVPSRVAGKESSYFEIDVFVSKITAKNLSSKFDSL